MNSITEQCQLKILDEPISNRAMLVVFALFALIAAFLMPILMDNIGPSHELAFVIYFLFGVHVAVPAWIAITTALFSRLGLVSRFLVCIGLFYLLAIANHGGRELVRSSPQAVFPNENSHYWFAPMVAIVLQIPFLIPNLIWKKRLEFSPVDKPGSASILDLMKLTAIVAISYVLFENGSKSISDPGFMSAAGGTAIATLVGSSLTWFLFVLPCFRSQSAWKCFAILIFATILIASFVILLLKLLERFNFPPTNASAQIGIVFTTIGFSSTLASGLVAFRFAGAKLVMTNSPNPAKAVTKRQD